MIVRILLLLAAALSFGGTAHAGDKPLYAPAPGWVLAAPAIDPAKLTDQDPILLRLDQQHRIEKDLVTIHVDSAMRIASAQFATQLSNLQLLWMPDLGDITIHTVAILRGGERVDVLGKGARFNVLQREQNLESGFLNGLLTATLNVEGLRVGDVLHVAYSVTRRDAALGGEIQSMAPLLGGEAMRIGFGRVRVMWPVDRQIFWRTYLQDAAVAVTENHGWREAVMLWPLPKQPELPADAPARFQRPNLFEVSSFADWRAVSSQMAPHYKTAGAIAPGSPLAAEVAKIRNASADPRVRTAMALQLVQDKVRYLFRGMENGSYIPQTPAQTWTLRYGDCKAKSLLLTAILRELGIEAELVLVSATAGDLVSKRLPMPGAFDHVIVRAVVDGKSLWLDGTSNGSRLSDIDDVPPFRHALPLREGGAELVAMPMRANARPEVEAVIDYDQSAGIHFPAPFKATVRVRGASAEMLRLGSVGMGAEQSNQMIDMLVDTNLPGQSNVIVSRSLRYDEATSTTVITAEGLAWSRWQREGELWSLSLDPTVEGLTFTPDRARPAWREIPVTSGPASDRSVRYVIRLPDGGTGFALEGSRTLPATLAGVILSRQAGMTGGVVTVEDRAVAGIREIAPADIPATRREVTQAKGKLLKIQAPAAYPPAWRAAELNVKGKAFAPIHAAFARYIAEQPDDADRYMYRAAFLESIFDRAGALRDMTRMLEIAPQAETYLERARLREAMGDDKGSMADIRAALELDPGSAAAMRVLATRLAREGKVDEALTMLAELGDLGGNEEASAISGQATILAENGRAEEGVALLDALIVRYPGNATLLNSRCWLKGTANVMLDTALRDCTKSIELSENPAAVLDSRGLIYLRMGRFDDALADLDAALVHAPGQAASLYLRGVTLKRQGKSGDADLAAARLISPRIDETYARYGIKP